MTSWDWKQKSIIGFLFLFTIIELILTVYFITHSDALNLFKYPEGANVTYILEQRYEIYNTFVNSYIPVTFLVLFGMVALFLEYRLACDKRWAAGDAIRLMGLTTIIILTVFVMMLSKDTDPTLMTAIIGFLGTIAGYLAGSAKELITGAPTYTGTPVVTIKAPHDGEHFSANKEVKFESTVNGGKEPFIYIWSSDIAGVLSNENSFSSMLKTGHHKINLKVTDANGDFDQRSIQIDVD